jgi:hypothetical protein
VTVDPVLIVVDDTGAHWTAEGKRDAEVSGPVGDR